LSQPYQAIYARHGGIYAAGFDSFEEARAFLLTETDEHYPLGIYHAESGKLHDCRPETVRPRHPGELMEDARQVLGSDLDVRAVVRDPAIFDGYR